MSWKMFVQIVLLIIITAIIMVTAKYGLYCTGSRGKWKCMKEMHGMKQKGMHKGMHQKGMQEK